MKKSPVARVALALRSCIIFLGLALASITPTDVAAEDLRILKVRVAADEAFRARSGWEEALRKRMKAASDIYEKHFSIRFEVVGFAGWKSPDFATGDNPEGYVYKLLYGLIDSVPAGNAAEIVLGFSGKNPRSAHVGVTNPYITHAVITDFGREERERETDVVRTVLHEVSHLFGMFHVTDANSIMFREANGSLKFETIKRRAKSDLPGASISRKGSNPSTPTPLPG